MVHSWQLLIVQQKLQIADAHHESSTHAPGPRKWGLYMHRDNPQQQHNLNDARALESIGMVRVDVREEWLMAQSFSNLQSSFSQAQNLAQLGSCRLSSIAFDPLGMQYLLREADESLDDYRAALHFLETEV